MEAAINLVLAQMQPILTCDQLKHLGEVLRYALSPRRDSSSDLLKLFLMAKEVEGCSPRTITYYESTIKCMVKSVGKPYTQIESDDLRAYLSDYNSKRKAGKVTIDNIRRILSSFFSWLEDEDLETLRDGCANARDLAIVDMLASTGCALESWSDSISPTSTFMSGSASLPARATSRDPSILMRGPSYICKRTSIAAPMTVPRCSSLSMRPPNESTLFGMFFGEERLVTLTASERAMNALVDRFGRNMTISNVREVVKEGCTERYADVTVRVAVSKQFEGWLKGLDGLVEWRRNPQPTV